MHVDSFLIISTTESNFKNTPLKFFLKEKTLLTFLIASLCEIPSEHHLNIPSFEQLSCYAFDNVFYKVNKTKDVGLL